jgi:hypothetical protein
MGPQFMQKGSGAVNAAETMRDFFHNPLCDYTPAGKRRQSI